MSFIEEIQELKTNRNNKENIVVNDIVDYFKEKMNSETFKNNLKENYIRKAINDGKDNCDLRIEFWEYSSGCSYTYISVSGCGKFELVGKDGDYNSYYNYKDIRLSDIHKRVCTEISKIYQEKLKELGLKVVNTEREDNKYRFGYYKEKITIYW